ncbi:MAG: DNA repair protein RadC [Syntrophales bacterium]|jgi:DNA repair protein RadC|nr:DNA repair protein RadC [Syntrophales bacterium]
MTNTVDEKDYNSGHRQRLKMKYIKAGIEALHDYEVVELLLTYAISRRDIKPLAKELLSRFGSLKGIIDAEPAELKKIDGISDHTAILFKLLKEGSALYLQQKAKEKPQISCTSELINFCRTILGGKRDEEFCVIYLDVQNQIIEFETLQKGTVNQATVYPRQVLENALRKKASAIILVHNHPSGHVRPSEADLRITKTISETARLLDINVHDHIIVGEDRFFSFREEGMLT